MIQTNKHHLFQTTKIEMFREHFLYRAMKKSSSPWGMHTVSWRPTVAFIGKNQWRGKCTFFFQRRFHKMRKICFYFKCKFFQNLIKNWTIHKDIAPQGTAERSNYISLPFSCFFNSKNISYKTFFSYFNHAFKHMYSTIKIHWKYEEKYHSFWCKTSISTY